MPMSQQQPRVDADYDLEVLQREQEKWLKITVASSSHRLRHRIPAVDLAANPFCAQRQLRDAIEQHELNKVAGAPDDACCYLCGVPIGCVRVGCVSVCGRGAWLPEPPVLFGRL